MKKEDIIFIYILIPLALSAGLQLYRGDYIALSFVVMLGFVASMFRIGVELR